MNCEAFRSHADKAADSRKASAWEDLPHEMLSHIEECRECARYFDAIRTGANAMADLQPVEIPADLYATLLDLGMGSSINKSPAFSRQMLVYILRIFIPAMLIWLGGTLLPAPASAVVELALMVFAMVLAFEKTARRLVTDRV